MSRRKTPAGNGSKHLYYIILQGKCNGVSNVLGNYDIFVYTDREGGGGRVIYFDTGTEIHFLLAYPKSVQSDLTPVQKELLHEATRNIRKEH